jgi:hypothetical protein
LRAAATNCCHIKRCANLAPDGRCVNNARSMYRTSVIAVHTFREVLLQPIYSLLLVVGAVVVSVFGALPFFTFGEDTLMFKSVSLDVVVLLVLIGTLFATSKSIFEEIEDRTMLTLMSKPLARWEVIAGKYLGIIVAAGVAIVALGLVMSLATWVRIPIDYQIRSATLDEAESRRLVLLRTMHLSGLWPQLFLSWMSVSVLASIGVALSTRFSLVVNLPVVILIYIAGNLTRFLLGPQSVLDGTTPLLVKGLAYALSAVLPFLQAFDLREWTLLSQIVPSSAPATAAGTGHLADLPGNTTLAAIWTSVAAAGAYAVAYVTFILALALLFFRNRELGGSEG